MANISAYPTINPKGADLIVGSETYDSTDATSPKGNPTRNFSVSSVVSTQIPSYVIGTTNKIPVFTSANKIQDSIMTETAAGGSFTGKYISITDAGSGLLTRNLELREALIDNAGSTGTDGFLLSSTTVGGDKAVAWINTSTFLSSYLALAGGTMSGSIVMDTNKITGLGNPTAAQDAGTKTYIDTADALKLNLTGGTVTGNIEFDNNAKAQFGSGGELEIFNDGTHSRIKDIGAGNLILNATDFIVNNSADNKQMITAVDGGSVSLFHDSSKKFETTSTGVTISGNANLTGDVTISGNANLAGDIYLPANKGIYFGGNTTSAYELDYYQEGTFTPTEQGTWTTSTEEISGMYTRVGNKVTINVKWKNGAMSSVGNGYFQNLPFSPKEGTEATELFTGSVMNESYTQLGVAAVKNQGGSAADARIYFSRTDFTGNASDKNFVTITYLVETA